MSNVAQVPAPIPKLSREVNAFLSTLRYAEGTDKYKNPYSTGFGGEQFDNKKGHPDKVFQGVSAAAGAYQFLPGTWNSVGGGPMTRERQDWGATRLALMRLGLPQNQAGVDKFTANLKAGGMSQGLAHTLAPEWASFPTNSGRSYYGQPVKSLNSLQNHYRKSLNPSIDKINLIKNDKKPLVIPTIRKTEKKKGPLSIFGF